MAFAPSYSLETLAIHHDAGLTDSAEVAPYISTSTTFRHPSLEQIAAANPPLEVTDPYSPERHIYSRETQPTVTRVEHVLSALLGGPTIVYPSGIAAFFAILLHVRPDVVAITGGYFGCHAALDIYKRTRGADQVSIIELDDEYPTDKKVMAWVESPVNPQGTNRSFAAYAKKVHAVGGTLGVDATLGPPPLQDPFKWGADIVMHSCTKYLGGHSDLLAGSVTVKNHEEWHALWEDRTHTGSNLGSLDSWLLLRSSRSVILRVERQAKTGTAIAQFLAALKKDDPVLGAVIKEVTHATLQDSADELVGEGKQMSTGPACFSFVTSKTEYATHLPHQLKLFIPATSLGGVESLIEQRVISDSKADPCLLRLSIGLEDVEDLKEDLLQGFRAVLQMEKETTAQHGA
ncbi:hypothetical protein JCM10207_009142 [Rhodosporidiobolus poonsookiae]